MMQPIQSIVPFSLVLVLSLTVGVFAQEKPATQKIDGKIEWVYDYEEGKKLSGTTGKPMFVVFRCER